LAANAPDKAANECQKTLGNRGGGSVFFFDTSGRARYVATSVDDTQRIAADVRTILP
jgi:hypothetical protein